MNPFYFWAKNILLHTFSHLKWNKIPFYYTNTIYSGIFLNASVLIWYNFSLCIWSRVLSCSHKQLKVGGLNEKEWAGGQRHLWWLAVSSTLRSPFAILGARSLLSLLLPVYTHRWDFTVAKRRKSYHDPLTLIVWRRWWRRWRSRPRSRDNLLGICSTRQQQLQLQLNNGKRNGKVKGAGAEAPPNIRGSARCVLQWQGRKVFRHTYRPWIPRWKAKETENRQTWRHGAPELTKFN